MPTTATATNTKKIRAPRTDRELASAAHESLLLWLRENLERIGVELWTHDQASVARALEGARDTAQSEVQRNARQLAALAERSPFDPEAAAVFRARAKELESFVVEAPTIDPRAGEPELAECHFQAAVHVARQPVGYVDCMAQFSEFEGFFVAEFFESWRFREEVSVLPPPDGRRLSPEESAQRRAQAEARQRRGQAELLQDLRLQQPDWSVERSGLVACFDVRATAPTAGDVLRDLRHLESLGLDERQHGPITPILVVDQLDPRAVAMIEHEGYRVVQRKVFEDKWSAARA